jgi:hypothetical protein
MGEEMEILLDKSGEFDIPIIFICYHRLDTTKKVLSRIREIQPTKLYIVSDGPQDVYGDKEKVNDVRNYIDTYIDWDCDVHKRYLQKNLGCRLGPTQGISWALENEKYAIILEDDCLPVASFFYYCRALLKRYISDERVMMVSGCNLHAQDKFGDYDAVFSFFSSIWGWATWKRAWDKYDVDIEKWKEYRKGGKLRKLFTTDAYMNIKESLNVSELKSFNGWDYQWDFTRYINNGLGIVPRNNMITNIGFGVGGVHYTSGNVSNDTETVCEMPDVIFIPDKVERDQEYDYRYQKEFYHRLKLKGRIRTNIKTYAYEHLPNFLSKYQALMRKKREKKLKV